MWRAWLATMSDIVRQAAIWQHGGIYCDLGDSTFPKQFAKKWVRERLGHAPWEVRVPKNPKALIAKDAVCQPIIIGIPKNQLSTRMLGHIEAMFHKDKAGGRKLSEMTMIGKTLVWTGNGALRKMMASIPVQPEGAEVPTDLLALWVAKSPDVRLAMRRKKPDAKMIIKASSNGSWMTPHAHGSF